MYNFAADLTTDEYINDQIIWGDEDYGYWPEDGWSDVEADADTLASAGWGTDEDYGWYGEQAAAYWDA
jgi:hypothetical protein